MTCPLHDSYLTIKAEAFDREFSTREPDAKAASQSLWARAAKSVLYAIVESLSSARMSVELKIISVVRKA